ncbi:LLM class flavin-dependent oxidoreductase [Amycolatopsis anabasis]|uniref:LLM class flavin-dependent oxidoreductase n=1 Tax=Amycolatopsis anabasis TaxID=1840409 RepID=UPI00131BE783|nr:LLM class flavin-dependent oxidoreductase [Amycolatopsis anabasis]
MAVDIGIFLPNNGNELPDIRDSARHAEAVGLDSLWSGDHLANHDRPSLDATLALATAAAVTERVQVGFSVFLPALRPHAWAAKQIATLQHLTGGDRFHLGIGVGGGYDAEWLAAGVPVAERGRRTDEFLRVLPALLAGEPTAIPGLPGEPEIALRPAVKAPPIWIGGFAPAALSRTIRHADGWFGALQTPDEFRATGARLAELAATWGRPAPRMATVLHCALVSRSAPAPDLHESYSDALAASYGMSPEDARRRTVTGTPEQVAERAAEFLSAGAEKLAFHLGGPTGWRESAELLAEVRAELVR